jgi:GR25 family glycosyltransferase involved in LPS biosynthesis
MIPKVYYINLDYRLDRKEQFLAEMKFLDIPDSSIERISGIYTEGFGILGCGLSHKKALETFYQSGEPYCIIFEDDFKVTLNKEYAKFLLNFPFKNKIEFDVIMLAGNIFKQQDTDYTFLKKVLDGQTASGFLITREFAPKLIEAFGESTKLLEDWWKQYHEKKHDACDELWHLAVGSTFPKGMGWLCLFGQRGD